MNSPFKCFCNKRVVDDFLNKYCFSNCLFGIKKVSKQTLSNLTYDKSWPRIIYHYSRDTTQKYWTIERWPFNKCTWGTRYISLVQVTTDISGGLSSLRANPTGGRHPRHPLPNSLPSLSIPTPSTRPVAIRNL